MKNVAISVNQGLLDMPDSMLTGRFSQPSVVTPPLLSAVIRLSDAAQVSMDKV